MNGRDFVENNRFNYLSILFIFSLFVIYFENLVLGNIIRNSLYVRTVKRHCFLCVSKKRKEELIWKKKSIDRKFNSIYVSNWQTKSKYVLCQWNSNNTRLEKTHSNLFFHSFDRSMATMTRTPTCLEIHFINNWTTHSIRSKSLEGEIVPTTTNKQITVNPLLRW